MNQEVLKLKTELALDKAVEKHNREQTMYNRKNMTALMVQLLILS